MHAFVVFFQSSRLLYLYCLLKNQLKIQGQLLYSWQLLGKKRKSKECKQKGSEKKIVLPRSHLFMEKKRFVNWEIF